MEREVVEYITDVSACPRCSEPHTGLAFRQLTNAPDMWDHWAMCPETDEPILMRLDVKDEPEQRASKTLEDSREVAKFPLSQQDNDGQ